MLHVPKTWRLHSSHTILRVFSYFECLQLHSVRPNIIYFWRSSNVVFGKTLVWKEKNDHQKFKLARQSFALFWLGMPQRGFQAREIWNW